ncbi:methionyl-tRNA formyltransferase [Haliangium sp.]|uniref:methionyl-tRNA formyltransferase n=1 Tax=Haliangium sp. TaxID=2663208 RepID=UPI003D12B0C5
MRVVFMGSPDFAVPPLQALLEHHDVVLVVTQPDKRAGRGRRLTAPPVKHVAQAAGVPVIQPASARAPAFAETLRETGAELAVVAAYGKILPPAVLTAFPLGCINVHASLLPKHRGAAPIQWAIIRGERETGITIMQLDEGMDTGPMLRKAPLAIEPDDTAGTLFQRMAPLGAEVLIEAMDDIAAGTAVAQPQDPDLATYAPMLAKHDGAVDWTQPARQVADLIRGVDPWPGAFTAVDGRRLKLFLPTVVPDDDVVDRGGPGRVVTVDERGLVVACGRGAVAIRAVQAAGGRRMEALAYAGGHPMPTGTILASAEELRDGSGSSPTA